MRRNLTAILGVLFLAGCSETLAENVQQGKMSATWYQHGTKTANGERFNPDGMTAAHRNLPFGTKLHLTYKDRSVIVRINDRGPFVRRHQLDLSRGAARRLDCSGNCVLDFQVVP